MFLNLSETERTMLVKVVEGVLLCGSLSFFSPMMPAAAVAEEEPSRLAADAASNEADAEAEAEETADVVATEEDSRNFVELLRFIEFGGEGVAVTTTESCVVEVPPTELVASLLALESLRLMWL